MKTAEFNGYYGSGKTECTVFVAYVLGSGKWYCVEGSKNVNFTHDEIEEGVNVEELSDSDCFTWNGGINSQDELVNAIEA